MTSKRPRTDVVTINVLQCSPGTGKTFFITSLVLTKVHCNYFIYAGPTHAVKSVLIHKLVNEHGLLQDTTRTDIKRATVLVGNVAGREVTIFVVTMDALVRRLAENSGTCHGIDIFEEMCAYIEKRGVDVGPDGYFRFKDTMARLGIHTIIALDEATKATVSHAKVLYRIAGDTGSNIFVCGDMLQSLERPDNCLAYLMNHPCENERVRIVKDTSNNVTRRLSAHNVHVLNTVVSTETYREFGIPVPVSAETNSGGTGWHVMPVIRKDDDEQGDKISNFVKKFMTVFRKWVDAMDLQPWDVLVIAPHVQNNPLLNALRDAIDAFWKQRFARDDEWFAYFHRTEGVGPVNTNDSANATRIVSIHTAQGDGRRLVFVLQLSEWRLRTFTRYQLRDRDRNLQYASLLNVALSRSAGQQEVFLEDMPDDVWRRCGPFVDPTMRAEAHALQFHIPDAFRARDLHWVDGVQDMEKRVTDSLERDAPPPETPPLVENEHHIARMIAFRGILYLRMMMRCLGSSPDTEPLLAVSNKIKRKRIVQVMRPHEYHSRLNSGAPDILLYCYGGNEATYNEIHTSVQAVQHALSKQDFAALTHRDLVVLWFLIDVHENGRWAMTDLRQVYAAFQDTDLQEHYAPLQEHVDRILADADATAGKYYLQHVMRMGRNSGEDTRDFTFTTKIDFMRIDDHAVTCYYIMPDLSSLRARDITQTLMATALVMTHPSKKNLKTYDRVRGKEVKCVVLSATCDATVCFDVTPEDAKVAVLRASIKEKCRMQHADVHRFLDDVGLGEANDRIKDGRFRKNAEYVLHAINKMYKRHDTVPDDWEDYLNNELEEALDCFTRGL